MKSTTFKSTSSKTKHSTSAASTGLPVVPPAVPPVKITVTRSTKSEQRSITSKSPASTSLLYSLLLRSNAARSGATRDASDRGVHSRTASFCHTPRVNADVDVSVSDAIRAEVVRLFPYRGVLVDTTEGDTGSSPSLSGPSTKLPSSARGAPNKKEPVASSKRWHACVASLNAYCDATDPEPVSAPQAAAATPAAVSSPTPSATASPRKKTPASTIVVKKRPPRKGVKVEAAAAAATAATTTTPTPAVGAPTVPPVDIAKASAVAAGAALKAGPTRFTLLKAAQLPASQARLKELLDDFGAAIEQCRVAIQQQQRSGSVAAWETARDGGEPSGPPARETAATLHSQSRRKSPLHCRGNQTVLVADAPPRTHSTHMLAEMMSPDSFAEVLQPELAGGYTPSGGAATSSPARSISVETPREAGEQRIALGGIEAVDLPRGLVMIAYAVAEHLEGLFHPALTCARLEEEAAALENPARGESSSLPPSSVPARRTHTGAARDESRSVSPGSRPSHSPSPLTGRCTSRGGVAYKDAPVDSTQLTELRRAAHTLIWDRITALVSSISLNGHHADTKESGAARGSGRDAAQASCSEEERCAQAYVQLPFWIWLYAASGLATDLMHAQEAAQHQITPADATTNLSSVSLLSLSQLLPTVDTLARQLQRRQYERVQPTAETLLTANTFLAFTGVKMTDKPIMGRLFPLQGGASLSDPLAFAALQPATSLLTHDANELTDVSAATTATYGQAATLASTATVSDAALSAEDPTLVANAGGRSGRAVLERGGSGVGSGRSLPYRSRGSFAINAGSPASGEDTQLRRDAGTGPSTVEMYLSWLRSEGEDGGALSEGEKPPGAAGNAEAAAHVERERLSEDAGGDSSGSNGGAAAVRCNSGARTQRYASSLTAGDGGEGDGAGTSRSSSIASSVESEESCATQQQQQKDSFQLSFVMASANLQPCLARVEQELHQARGALQFARKLGTLYATQDMNTLLPLLPAVVKEEGTPTSVANPVSARAEGSGTAARGSTDACATSLVLPTPQLGNGSLSGANAVRLPQSVTSPLNVAGGPMVPGGLPPLIVTPSHANERQSGNLAMLTSHRVTATATMSTLFPSVIPPSMEKESLMGHLNTCGAAMTSASDQFFVSSARALEVAFSLSVVLLSHVLGAAVLKGEGAAAGAPPKAMVAASATPEAGAKRAVTPAAVAATSAPLIVKKPPLGASASLIMSASTAASGAAAAAAPGPEPLSIDLAHVFGFGRSQLRYRHVSGYVRETLISVALSALQQKDVVMTQELLQYIALDTAIAHHYAQTQEQKQQQQQLHQQQQQLQQQLAQPTSLSSSLRSSEGSRKMDSPTILKTRKAAKQPPGPPPAPSQPAVGRWVAALQNNSASFVNVWFSSFAHLADTTKHLLKGDHSTPSSLKEAVWHLAGLAQYFLLIRARGYDMYGGRSHLSAASRPGFSDDLSAMALLLSRRGGSSKRSSSGGLSSFVASPALQHYIKSQLVEPADKVLGVIVSFMESIADALSVDMESGAAMERQQREGVMFADTASEDENSVLCPATEAPDYPGSACDSPSQFSSEAGVGGGGGGGGGGYGSAANRSEAPEAQTCWMELAIHYFLEIVDVLLDAALYLPEKPLLIYQLTVNASRMPAFTSDFIDVMMTVGLAGLRSPPMSGPADLQNDGAAPAESGVDSPLDRFQEFLSSYASLVMQAAVSRFTVEGLNVPAWMATARATPANNSHGGSGGSADDRATRNFWASLLGSVTASLTPVGLEDIALSSARPGGNGGGAVPQPQQQPPLTSRSAGVPASARAAVTHNLSTPSYSRSTMWWPEARFQRYPHLIRVLEHAQLLCLYLNTPGADAAAAPGSSGMAYMDGNRSISARDAAPTLRVSAVTALLNTSTGPCAQLLSVPYVCPPLMIEATSRQPPSAPNTSRDRQVFHSPMEQPQARYAAAPGSSPRHRVLSDRVLREVCGGLWIRVEVLQLLRLAAAPLDVDGFASFSKMAASMATRVRDKSMQSHYRAVAAMKPSSESVLPKTYASTYVRLLFLRYVQAFYADMQALGAAGHAASFGPTSGAAASSSAGQEHANTDRLDGTWNGNLNSSGFRPSPPGHTSTSNNGETTARTIASPRTRAPSSPLQHLSQRLWTQYCYQLLWALRELCWSSSEAHETASTLSIASVFGRLLQMISGRVDQEEYDEYDEEDEEDDALDVPEFDLNEAELASIITFDRSLVPYCTAENGKPEGFADFESSSNDSKTAAGSTQQPTQTQQPSPKAPTDGNNSSECSWSPGTSTVTGPATQAGSGVGEAPPAASSEAMTQGPQNASSAVRSNSTSSHPRSPSGDTYGRSTSPSVATTALHPALPQLALTGLKPPLYFASSGDTAAAQEDDYFKEQSKQRQKAEELEERQRNVASVSVMDANSYISEEEDEYEDEFEEELEDFELSSGSPQPSTKNPTSVGGSKCSQTSGRTRLTQQTDNAGPETNTAPPPPVMTIPKLSLGALGPPLYFTSTGDTGVFAEGTVAPPPGPPAAPITAGGVVIPALNLPTAGSPKTSGAVTPPPVPAAKYADPNASPTNTGDKVTLATPAPPPPPPPLPILPLPTLPSFTTKTVEGFALPKLSFGALGPPMYFTSTGDTGGFVEAQNSAPPVVPPPANANVTVGGLALPKLSFGALGPPMYFTSTGDTGGFVEAQNSQKVQTPGKSGGKSTPSGGAEGSARTARFRTGAAAMGAPPIASSPEGGNTPATAGRLQDFSLSDESGPDSVFSSFAAFAATHKDEDDGSDECDSRAGDLDEDDEADMPGGSGSSFASSEAPDDDDAVRGRRLRKKRTRRATRLSVIPVVPPVVTVELILSLCSIILQRDSGMIQYAYTVSSLTQKRVLPGVSTAQRRWRTTGNNVASPNASSGFAHKSAFTGSSVEGDQTDRWRYTPQHSPSSFHVIQALHNYLKDQRNCFVVDLLEEWMLDEYAETERLRMERFEAEYGVERVQGCSRPPSLSSTMRSNFNFTATNVRCWYSSVLSLGRFVLLRLLLPRAITHLVTQHNERRIGAGGYGSVTSGTVHDLDAAAAELPPSWGRHGCHWRPAADGGGAGAGTSRSASASFAVGAGSPVPPEKVLSGALEALRAPWRVAVHRIAQAVCRREVAIKHIPLNAQGSESGNLPVCHAEVLAMCRLRGHPHIVPLLSFDNTRDEYILVMQNYALGSFRVWRQKHYQLGYAVLSLPSEPSDASKSDTAPPTPSSAPSSSLFATCARCLLQILDAVVCMHEQHIRHGDIKCDNVLIDTASANKETTMDPGQLPTSVRLCDFGSCDTCADDDIRNLKNDIMAGEARFMAGRWGVGRGTEAIQPPEVMSAKRRYTFFRRTMATHPASATYALPSQLELTERGAIMASVVAPSGDPQHARTRTVESVEEEERAMTERLRRAELSVDVWACGCLLYEMLTGRMLFGEARLGRLLVLAAADDEAEQGGSGGWRHTSTGGSRLGARMSVSNADATPLGASPVSPSPSSRKALDEWERRDLENAVGPQVVNFMSSLLDLDPLQRPTAMEALYHWKEIMMEFGLDV